MIITSRAFVGFFVRGTGGGEGQNRMNKRMHQCTTLNTNGIYKNSFFGKCAYERLLFFKQIPELRPKLIFSCKITDKFLNVLCIVRSVYY